MRLKILYIGTFGDRSDEGLSQISKQYYSHFNNNHDVKCINTFEAINPSSLKKTIEFRPDIIHYLTGPTIRSFVITSILKSLLRKTPKTILSATRPFLKDKEKNLTKFFKPNIIFSQASKWEIIFNKNNIQTFFIPNFIDINKFKQINTSKKELRIKYNLPSDKKILLHVGHIKENRKLNFFIRLQNTIDMNKYHIVIIGGALTESNSQLPNLLKKTGKCILIKDYLENIEEIYNACDYYVFPVNNLQKEYYAKKYDEIGAIDMPLSILEAMACRLPVITTSIDALHNLIKDINNPAISFFDIDNKESFLDALSYVEKQKKFDFLSFIDLVDKSKVCERIDDIYRKLVGI